MPKKTTEDTPEKTDHDKTMEEIAEEVAQESKEVEEVKDPIKEEKAVEEPTEEGAQPVKEEDLQAKEDERQQLRKEISQDFANKINKVFGVDDEATSEQKDKYQEYAEKFFEEKGRNPYWHELIPMIREEAVQSIKAEQEAAQKATQEEQEKAREIYQKNLDAFQAQVTEELNELYTSGKLPKIKDETDKNDYGVKVRDALYNKMIEVNNARTSQGLNPITSISRIFSNHFKLPDSQPAGYDAPVSIGQGGTPTNNTDIDYHKDIHNATFEQIMMEAQKN